MTTLPPEGEPEQLPELTRGESERLLNDVMDALHRARLFPAEEDIIVICGHRMDSGKRVDLMLQANSADVMRTKGVLMTLLQRLP